MKVLKNFR